jgi:hypothetical protein
MLHPLNAIVSESNDFTVIEHTDELSVLINDLKAMLTGI